MENITPHFNPSGAQRQSETPIATARFNWGSLWTAIPLWRIRFARGGPIKAESTGTFIKPTTDGFPLWDDEISGEATYVAWKKRILLLAAGTEQEAVGRARNVMAVRQYGARAARQILREVAEAGNLVLHSYDWGWAAMYNEKPCEPWEGAACVAVLDFGTAYVVADGPLIRSMELGYYLAARLREAGVPCSQIENSTSYFLDVGNTAASKLAAWLAQEGSTDPAECALDVMVERPTHGQRHLQRIILPEWEQTLQRRRKALPADREVWRLVQELIPAYKLGPVATAILL